jgi:hypothetical protein
MAKDERQPTQQTQPKKGKPVEIPVPKREDFLRDLKKVASPARESVKPDEGKPDDPS